MAKNEQALLLDPPSELHFKAPFTDVTTSYLNLTNPTEKHICFKVKTTAPKTYCVRPNSGVVAPKETVSIAVMLQPFDLELADKSKHKFMVQSMFVPEGEINQENLWREAPPEGIMNSKLKCVFDVPSEKNESSFYSVDQQPREDIKIVPPVVIETARSASPKPMAATASIELEARKVFEDNKRLKVEMNELRQENSTLKEEGLRYRVASDNTKPRSAATSSSPSSLRPLAAKPQLLGSEYSYSTLAVISVVIFCLGLYLGKSLL